MRNIDHIFLLSEALDEFIPSEIDKKDLLLFADLVCKADQSDYIGDFDRPLNSFNPNYFSRPVDTAINENNLRLAIAENSFDQDKSDMDIFYPKSQFDQFCQKLSKESSYA